MPPQTTRSEVSTNVFAGGFDDSFSGLALNWLAGVYPARELHLLAVTVAAPGFAVVTVALTRWIEEFEVVNPGLYCSQQIQGDLQLAYRRRTWPYRNWSGRRAYRGSARFGGIISSHQALMPLLHS
jgi:hypothetical protein